MRCIPSVSSLQTKICHVAHGCLRCMTVIRRTVLQLHVTHLMANDETLFISEILAHSKLWLPNNVFSEGDYVDTSEHRLIQEIFGIPKEIPLVEVDFQNDKLQGKILCGLVDSLPYGVDLLVGNDLEGIMPLAVTVVTRAGTDTSNTQNVVRPERNNVQDIGSDFDGVDDNEMNVLNDVDVAHNITTTRSAPVNQNDDFASDLDRLFTVDVPPVIPTDEIVTRMQLIEMQHDDVSLHKLFVLAKSPHAITDVTYFETRSDVLVRCSRDKFSPAGLEVTQIVVPQLLRAKLL